MRNRHNLERMVGWNRREYPVLYPELNEQEYPNELLAALGGSVADIRVDDKDVTLVGENGNGVSVDKTSFLMVINAVLTDDCTDV